MYSISLISFDELYQIWDTKLWPGRTSKIEDRSAMVYLSDEYDIRNMNLPVWFFGCLVDNRIIGVNSVHQCGDGSFRSRGLWVDNIHRGKGLGTLLLTKTVEIAKTNNCTFIWSFPRKSSCSTYTNAGFSISSEWVKSETSEANAYCKLL